MANSSLDSYDKTLLGVLNTYKNYVLKHPICLVDSTVTLILISFIAYKIVGLVFSIEIKIQPKNEKMKQVWDLLFSPQSRLLLTPKEINKNQDESQLNLFIIKKKKKKKKETIMAPKKLPQFSNSLALIRTATQKLKAKKEEEKERREKREEAEKNKKDFEAAIEERKKANTSMNEKDMKLLEESEKLTIAEYQKIIDENPPEEVTKGITYESSYNNLVEKRLALKAERQAARDKNLRSQVNQIITELSNSAVRKMLIQEEFKVHSLLTYQGSSKTKKRENG